MHFYATFQGIKTKNLDEVLRQLFGHTGNWFVKVVEMSDDEVVAEPRREHWLCSVTCSDVVTTCDGWLGCRR
jgi:hypothetical protein